MKQFPSLKNHIKNNFPLVVALGLKGKSNSFSHLFKFFGIFWLVDILANKEYVESSIGVICGNLWNLLTENISLSLLFEIKSII